MKKGGIPKNIPTTPTTTVPAIYTPELGASVIRSSSE